MTDTRAFRDALGAFATGIVVVTTRDLEGRDVGLTASSFNSVSLDPAMVLWSLGRTSSSLEAFRAADCFAVHILAADQDDLSRRFSAKGIDRFAGLPLERGEGGVPLLQHCATRFECRTVHRYEGGDHIIFVGQVLSFAHSARPPLIFHGGRYGVAVKKGDEQQAPAPQAGDPVSDSDLNYLLWRAFLQIRQGPHRHRQSFGWSDRESAVMQMVARRDGATVAELDRMIAFSGLRCTPDAVRSLVERGLVRANAPVNEASEVSLTAEGRAKVVELLAMARGIEADALADLDFSEVQLLKQWLRRVIARTNPAESPAP
jgi:3-hydroxy-9,10-secoandrosta-1,3,5(10)-triene-9,17-dione monooxygenase reductase component